MSPCVSAARTVQSACSPTGAPSARYAVLCAKLSDENSCCVESNDPVVSRLTCPENGVAPKKLEARRADELVTRPNTFCPPKPLPSAGASAAATTASGTVASFRMVRRAWRSRHASSPWSSLPVAPAATAGSAAGAGSGASGTPAASTGREPGVLTAFATVTCRSAIADDTRPLGRTSITCAREATKPVRCARSRYGPGERVRISNRPLRSLTANAVEAPSADTVAPATGAPCSSCTVP